MRYLLAFFFLLVYVGDDVGMAVSLGPGMSLKNLLLYLVLTGIAVNAAVTRNRKVEMTGVLVMFTLLIVYALATWVALTFVLQDPEYEVRGAFIAWKSSLVDQFLTYLIFFYGLLALRDAMWLLRAILWIVMLGHVITVIDTMNIPDLGVLPNPEKGGRFAGFVGQPNAYGQLLALFLPACIVLFLESRRFARLLAGVGVFASTVALVLTGSRGAYVGVFAGALLACFYLRRYVPAQTVVRACVAVAFVGAVVIVTTYVTGYSDLYVDRFSGLEGTAHVATSGRSSIWSNAIESMLESPLSFVSGYGFHAYDSSRTFRLATHNMYLGYLYDLGMIGLFLFIAVFVRIFSMTRSAIADASDEQRLHLMALVFGLASFLLSIFFSDYHEVGYLLWAYAGVVMRIAVDLHAQAAVPVPVTPPAAPPGERARDIGPRAPAWSRPDLGSARR